MRKPMYRPAFGGRFNATEKHLRVLHRPQLTALLDQASRLSIIGLFGLALVYAVAQGRFFFVPLTTALMIGLTLGPIVDWLERRHVPSYLASALLIALIALGTYGLYLVFAQPLQEWIVRMPEIADKLASHLRSFREPIEKLNAAGREVEEAAGMGNSPVSVDVKESGVVTTFLTLVPPLAGQLLLFAATLFFFLANRTTLRASALSFCVSRPARLRTARILRDTEFFLSRYVAAISVVNLFLGVATWLAMLLLEMPSPGLWGMLAAVCNFIPYVGPAFVALTLAGVGIITFDNLFHALTPGIVFLGLNLIEGQFVTPAVLGKNLTLNPFLVFLALGFWMWLWGPVGAFIAVPLLLIGFVVANHLLPNSPHTGAASFGKPAARARKLKAA